MGSSFVSIDEQSGVLPRVFESIFKLLQVCSSLIATSWALDSLSLMLFTAALITTEFGVRLPSLCELY